MYEQFFNLKEEPFNITPDPRYLYLSQRHLEALACINYGIERRKGFIEITGEIGSGKTTLCRSFLAQLQPHVKHALIFNPCLSEMQIMESILTDFGVSVAKQTKKAYFDALNDFLLKEHSKGNTVVVIIDEAQNLDPTVLEQIRLLSNLETETDKLLQIVFFGQPEFRDMLERPSMEQLYQRINIRFHLTALEMYEMTEYIYHRLAVAGGENHAIGFTSRALQVVYEYSRGIPRLINTVCDKVLMAAYINNTRQITYQIAEQAIGEVKGRPSHESHFEQLLLV